MDLWYFLASIFCLWLWPSDRHPPSRSKTDKGRLMMRVVAKASTFAQAVPHQSTKLPVTIAKWNWTWRLNHEAVSQMASKRFTCVAYHLSAALRLALTMPYQWALSCFILLYCGRCDAYPLAQWHVAKTSIVRHPLKDLWASFFNLATWFWLLTLIDGHIPLVRKGKHPIRNLSNFLRSQWF